MKTDTRRFPVSTLVAAVGCDLDTFQKWRSRNGLFPATRGKGGWNRYSVVDFFITRLVTVLTRIGIGASAAVEFAMIPEVEFHFDQLLQLKPDALRFLACARRINGEAELAHKLIFFGIQSDETIPEIMTEGDVLMVIDLVSIVRHVYRGLMQLEPKVDLSDLHEIVYGKLKVSAKRKDRK